MPVVCPHSLQGWMASSAVAAGELPEVVARGIGHASAQMTLAHYIAPGIAQAAQLFIVRKSVWAAGGVRSFELTSYVACSLPGSGGGVATELTRKRATRPLSAPSGC